MTRSFCAWRATCVAVERIKGLLPPLRPLLARWESARELAALSQDAVRVYPEDFNAYLMVHENGRITVRSGKIEMGQGVLTSQAQMIADELGVSLGSIDMVLGDTDRCPADMVTFGSLTTRMFGPVLRAAAAQARLRLMTLAAQKLRVPKDRLSVKEGVISVIGEPHRRLSYGELSKGARIGVRRSAYAVFDATGVRMLRLPMTADRVRRAIQRGSDARA